MIDLRNGLPKKFFIPVEITDFTPYHDGTYGYEVYQFFYEPPEPSYYYVGMEPINDGESLQLTINLSKETGEYPISADLGAIFTKDSNNNYVTDSSSLTFPTNDKDVLNYDFKLVTVNNKEYISIELPYAFNTASIYIMGKGGSTMEEGGAERGAKLFLEPVEPESPLVTKMNIIKNSIDTMKTKLNLSSSTSLDALTSEVGTSDIYKVASIQERDNLDAKEGDIALVYNKSDRIINKNDTELTTITFPETVALESQISGNANLRLRPSEGYEPEVQLFSSSNEIYVDIMNGSEYYSFTYTSQDGLNFTISGTYPEDRTFTTETPIGTEPDTWEQYNSAPLTPFIHVVNINFSGLYQYSANNEEWAYLDIGLDVETKNIMSTEQVYSNMGKITGSLVRKDFKMNNFVISNTEPSSTNKPLIWLKPKAQIDDSKDYMINYSGMSYQDFYKAFLDIETNTKITHSYANTLSGVGTGQVGDTLYRVELPDTEGGTGTIYKLNLSTLTESTSSIGPTVPPLNSKLIAKNNNYQPVYTAFGTNKLAFYPINQLYNSGSSYWIDTTDTSMYIGYSIGNTHVYSKSGKNTIVDTNNSNVIYTATMQYSSTAGITPIITKYTDNGTIASNGVHTLDIEQYYYKLSNVISSSRYEKVDFIYIYNNYLYLGLHNSEGKAYVIRIDTTSPGLDRYGNGTQSYETEVISGTTYNILDAREITVGGLVPSSQSCDINFYLENDEVLYVYTGSSYLSGYYRRIDKSLVHRLFNKNVPMALDPSFYTKVFSMLYDNNKLNTGSNFCWSAFYGNYIYSCIYRQDNSNYVVSKIPKDNLDDMFIALNQYYTTSDTFEDRYSNTSALLNNLIITKGKNKEALFEGQSISYDKIVLLYPDSTSTKTYNVTTCDVYKYDGTNYTKISE